MTKPATVAEVADWLGVSSRRVRELRAEGVLPGKAGDDYDLRECVRAYCAHIRPAAGKAAGGGSEAAVDLDGARTKLITAQTRKVDLQIQLLEAAVIPADEMESVVGAAFDAARAKLLAVPAAYGPRLAVMNDPNDIRETLTKALHEALGDLSEGEVVAAVKDRARRVAGRIEGSDEAGPEAGAST